MTDDDATPAAGSTCGETTDRDIHVLETGEGWEVWRKDGSMPLGTFMTRSEADERAAAQAAEEGVAYIDHDMILPDDGEIEV